MKTAEIIATLENEDTRNAILAGLKEADRRSYENTDFCYCVAVYEDGRIEIREHLGNKNAVYANDEAIARIGEFSRQTWDMLTDYYDGDREQMLNDLREETANFPEEMKAYAAHCETQDRTLWTRNDVLDDELEWLENHAVCGWNALERFVIDGITDNADSEMVYENILDTYVEERERKD